MPNPTSHRRGAGPLALALGAAALTAALAPGRAAAAEPWPELRFGRAVALAPVSAATLSFGGGGALSELDERLAVGAAGGVGYAHPLPQDVALHGALFVVQGVRGSRTIHAVGQGRFGLSWQRADWALAGGGDFWVGDEGASSWFGSASPWAAAAWLGPNVHAGVQLIWDRSDEVGPLNAVATWAEDARAGLRPTATVGGRRGPVHGSLSYGVQLPTDFAAVASDVLAADLRWPIDFELATLTPILVARGAVGAGRDTFPPTFGLVLRLDFDVRALGQELFGGGDDEAAAAPAFDPFD